MCYQNDQASKYVQESHDWHDLFCEACDTVDTSDENDSCNNCHEDTNSDSRYVECIVKCNSDRVGLYHITHESQCKDDGYREETGKELTESAFKYVFDVIYRTADYSTVFYFAGVFRKANASSFSVNPRNSAPEYPLTAFWHSAHVAKSPVLCPLRTAYIFFFAIKSS